MCASTESCPLKQDPCSGQNLYFDTHVLLDVKSSFDTLMQVVHTCLQQLLKRTDAFHRFDLLEKMIEMYFQLSNNKNHVFSNPVKNKH